MQLSSVPPGRLVLSSEFLLHISKPPIYVILLYIRVYSNLLPPQVSAEDQRSQTPVTGLCKTEVLACRNKSCPAGQHNLAFGSERTSEKSHGNWLSNGRFLPPSHCFLLIMAELKQAACLIHSPKNFT